jgi:hypothetical protein
MNRYCKCFITNDGVFGSNIEEIIDDWRKLHIEVLYYLHWTCNVVRVVISGNMRCI